MNPKVLIILVIVVLLMGVGVGVGTQYFTKGDTSKLGFENIGELATQSVRCTSVRTENKDRDLYGWTIPFTTSKLIYSYDTDIKAGMDFSQIRCDVYATKVIKVKLPKMKIMSSEIDYKSFKAYHEEESMFSPITMEEHNQSMTELVEQAQKDAIDNGLLEKAEENAKILVKTFIGQLYDLDEYKVEFIK